LCYEEPVTADNWGGLFDGDDAANAEITDDWDKPSTASTDEPSLVHVLRHDPPLLVESRLYALRVAQELGARPRAGGRARVLTGEDDGDHQPHDLGLGRVAPVPVPGLHQALQHVVVSGSDGGAPARPDDLGEDTRERCAHTITLPQHRRWGVQEQKAGQIRDLLPHLVDFVKHPLPHLLPQQAPRRDQQQHLLVVPSTINIRVPTNCSMKYPCHIFDVAVMALMSAGCSNKELELAPHTRCWSAQLSNIWMGNGCYAYGELCFLWKPPWRGFICVQECMLLQFDSLNILASQASEISSPSVIIPTEQLKVLKMLLAEGFMVNGTVLNFYADNWHYRVVVQWEHPVNWANDCSASFCWIWKPPWPLVNLPQRLVCGLSGLGDILGEIDNTNGGQPAEASDDGDPAEVESCVAEKVELGQETTHGSTGTAWDGGNGGSYFPWRDELESLVHGGVPMALRGEICQAIVDVGVRSFTGYYNKLLDDRTKTLEAKDLVDPVVNEQGSAPRKVTQPEKWKGQIEKGLLPGHPALDENWRNALMHLLIVYARHNPSVGYCQAMNLFAELFLFLCLKKLYFGL
jgi:hypothetical protein